MPKIVGVDFDDVIVSTYQAVALWHNRVHRTSYELKDIVSWELAELWGCTKEESYKRVREFYGSLEHSTTETVCLAVESLKLLSDNELHIITARQDNFSAVTLELAKLHVPFLLHKFNFINLVTDEGIVRRTKAEVCIELGVEVFIDDHLDYALNVASVGIPVLLFDRPWNQTNELPRNIERVYSWKEIVNILL